MDDPSASPASAGRSSSASQGGSPPASATGSPSASAGGSSAVAHSTIPDAPGVTPAQRALAYFVHLFTASGVVFAFLAAAEVCKANPDPRLVFLYLAIQCLIDALDGPMARAFQVKTRAPRIDGRTIDDIVDYLTFTFVPLLLIWKMGWLPEPAGLFVAPAMVASLFGFSNTGAKDEQGGFFLGFPSYWNIVAVYAGVWFYLYGPWVGAVVIVALTILTVMPVRFIYPNLAPRPWKMPVMIGALIWALMLAWMIWRYPNVSATMMWISLVYPIFYGALSVWLDARSRG
ncbi:MAG: phosphatidylcholine synthase [Planctomycetota bacterium]|nr:phosphatidylcholine synthase [Planctomycetota bacterium]